MIDRLSGPNLDPEWGKDEADEMTNTHAHPAAAILAEIAEEWKQNPKPWLQYQVYQEPHGEGVWRDPADMEHLVACLMYGAAFVRRRPRTVEINGWQVPEPVREPLRKGMTYWVTSPSADPGIWTWNDDETDHRFLRRGLIHLTPEAAEAHGRALASFTSREDEG